MRFWKPISAIRFRATDARQKAEGDAVEGRFAVADVDVLSFFGCWAIIRPARMIDLRFRKGISGSFSF